MKGPLIPSPMNKAGPTAAAHWIFMIGLSVLVALAGCGRASHKGLTLAGSTSLQPFAEKWADAFRAHRPDVQIHVQGGGSTAGVQAALSGAAQIGMSSRALTPDEARRIIGIPVARDGIALIVNRENRVGDLLLEQARAIYAGEVRNWRQLGGRDAPITVITREEGSGTRGAFETLVMAGRRIAASALVQDSTGAVRQMVASDPAAIGYISIGLVDTTVKALRLRNVEANEANIDAGTYPLVRPFLFVISGDARGAAKDFIDWVTGPEGREITRREGLLPLRSDVPHARG
jgi:phosphate transport system substrate-binding protein